MEYQIFKVVNLSNELVWDTCEHSAVADPCCTTSVTLHLGEYMVAPHFGLLRTQTAKRGGVMRGNVLFKTSNDKRFLTNEAFD